MGAPPPSLLGYAITPPTVNFSGSDGNLSIVTITLTATNGTDAPISCGGITASIPYDADPQAQNALTVDPTTIAAVPDDSTPWTIWGRGDGTWHAVPLPPSTAVAPGQQLSFVFSGIVVNQKQGPVTVAIKESSGAARTGGAGLTKSGEAQPGQGPASITTFTAEPAQVAQGGQVEVDWATQDATTCLLFPGPVTLATSGTMKLPVHDTTTFTLRALSPGGEASRSVLATVMPVEITDFSATPSSVAPGGTVTLAWSTQFAAGCAIGPGVGAVPPSGSTQVQPQQTTVYSLTATGLAPQTRTATVEVPS